jgi:uncharacterized protein (TIGR02246 family)
MKLLGVLAVGLVMLSVPCARAQSGLSAEDKQAIGATMDAVGDDLFKLDFAGFGALLTDDCDWINIVGMHWAGKAQVVKGHTGIFSTRYKGMMMQQMERSISELAPGTALVINKQSIGPDKTADGKPIDNVSIMTVVMVKRGGKWLIRAGENVTIDSKAALHDPVKMP